MSTAANPVGKSTGCLSASLGRADPSDVLTENPVDDTKGPARQGSASPSPFPSPAAVLVGGIATLPLLTYTELSLGSEMQRGGQ